METRQVSNKWQKVMIGIGLFLMVFTIILVILRIRNADWIENYNIVELCNIMLFFFFLCSVCSLYYGYSGLKKIKQINLFLQYPDFSFDYEKELCTYKIIGLKDKEKKIASGKAKNGEVYFQCYTDWENYLLKRYSFQEKNKVNFFHYLRREYRRHQLEKTLITSLVIPIEIFFLTVLLTCKDLLDFGSIELFFIVVMSICFLGAFLTIKLKDNQNVLDFLVDINEILINDEKLHLD